MVSRVLFSSKTDEWETPQDLFDELDKEFEFNLDVCATRENTKCRNWYSKDLNGLKQAWILGSGVMADYYNNIKFSTWCNPPYSQIGKWVEKAYNQKKKYGNLFFHIVMLLPARTDTKWFHKYIYNNEFCEIRFIKGRLKFSNSKNSAPFPSMIVIF